MKKGDDIRALSRFGFRRRRLLILAYHAIADLRDDRVLSEFAVPEPLFRAHLETLSRRGWEFVDLDAVLAALAGRASLPRRGILLTFDDGYADLRRVVDSLLAPRRLPAVVLVVAGQIGGVNEWDRAHGAAELDLLDADAIRAIAAMGVEVGSHSSSHRSLPALPEAQLGRELTGAAESISALGLPRPRAFSYPFGEWTPALAAAVAEAGYSVAFTTDKGVVLPGGNPHAVPRIEVHASDTPRKLLWKLALAGWPGSIRDGLLWLRRVRLDPVPK